MSRYSIPDPKCQHANQRTLVSSHSDLVAAAKSGDAMASVWVCDRELCIEDAKEWVSASTHRNPLVRPR